MDRKNTSWFVLNFFINIEHKLQFQHFNSTGDFSKCKTISEVDEMNQQINKKLKGTNLTVDILEKLYNNDTMFHVLMDLKGNSIWFNTSFMELTGRKPTDMMKPNFVEISKNMNKDHPFTEIFVQFLQDQPKEYKCKNFIFILNESEFF
jgi:transcriptional regulator with PAS, ATPase and Fis domain